MKTEPQFDVQNVTSKVAKSSNPFEQMKYDEGKVWGIRLLLSYGFTDKEIAEKLAIHRITVGRYKKIIKLRYYADGGGLIE
jgi:hypothetical protein